MSVFSGRKLTSHANPALDHWHFAEGTQEPSLWFRFCRGGLRGYFSVLWRVRVFNRHVEPATGGAVYISNHQSFLDPILMSYGLRRPMNYMARDSLFHLPLFKQLISSVYAFPVKRGTADLSALKEAMRRVKAGGQVVLFAEGTRTQNGRIGPFLPGVAMLAQRTGATTVPVVIDGAFECWPRTQMLPSLGEIVVQYGNPIPSEESKAMTSEALMTRVRAEMIEMQADIRRRLGRPELKY